ncbi:MAG TPA: VOC family protein [Streptosporangiaceae bacterium]|nr:VOC family protein [Streptosporangiaceae bacterium]
MPATSNRATHITGVRTIGVPVRDQRKALEFYTTVLGFSKRLDVPTPQGTRWIEVSPSSGGPSIALVQEHDGVPAGVETGIRLTTPDADAARATLLACGVDASEVLRWPGVPPMFSFRDQDGNALELVQQP